MKPHDDPNSEGNGTQYLTGRDCIENCGRAAGTAWSPYWCCVCNAKRMNRISAQLQDMLKQHDDRIRVRRPSQGEGQ